MPNLKKAKHHHTKAGTALEGKNFKAAAHHLGHALSALRSDADETTPFVFETGTPAAAAPAPSGRASMAEQVSLRDRLKRMKSAKPLPDSYEADAS